MPRIKSSISNTNPQSIDTRQRPISLHNSSRAVRAFSTAVTAWPIVEPAHMELAEPSIATALGRCVQQGAEWVILFPYFLGPGRHSTEDIPRLAAEAAAQYPGLRYRVTSPLGLHPSLLQVIDTRIAECLHSLPPRKGD